ncbi:hypothetical protein [Streptomyces sp. JB150]|uniref:hypothetical protein n=1 Tax=Streptomyces sp. JB150 TaxID=2714844 RepID=UPI00140A4274|nr:hypothetical protein [Streptomyces sp. JB150]QIJ65062.1 hypothetical protein G7Z13_25790 [Streptomyces sp. JB150]
MNREHSWTGRCAMLVSAACMLVTTLSSCGTDEPERDYAVPAELCGISLASDDLTPFLPTGEDLEVREKKASGVTTCHVIVDKKLIVTATQAWLKEGKNTSYFAYSRSLGTQENVAKDGRFRYSGNEAFGKTNGCVDSRYGRELYTAVQAQGSEHENADAMKRLITSYTREVEASAACEAGSTK